jgi:hypothetical protein
VGVGDELEPDQRAEHRQPQGPPGIAAHRPREPWGEDRQEHDAEHVEQPNQHGVEYQVRSGHANDEAHTT